MIILAINLNDNIIDYHFLSLLASIRLDEAITNRHSKLYRLQNTHQMERLPIDGIFIPNHISIISAGYYLVGDAPSDYRVIWLKFKISDIFYFKIFLVALVIQRKL